MKRTGLFAVLALAPFLAACPGNPLDGTVCTADLRPAILVEVRDARTGASALTGATVVARNGSAYDSVTVRDPQVSSVGLAHELPGTYEVVVRRDGYREWKRSGVRVEKDECHVITARVEAVLEPVQ
ncbi:MAG TPA: carboxypeptidase-like regulatory domain-containing protein [Longimicrobiaceae bacterium]|nr:carboxypeptidase-like regulatory domain-containing protein [Longimicrobiaceae bacterium]